MGRSHITWETSVGLGSKGCSKSKSHLSLSRSASVTSSYAQLWSWLALLPPKDDKNRQLSWPLGLNLSYLAVAQKFFHAIFAKPLRNLEDFFI